MRWPTGDKCQLNEPLGFTFFYAFFSVGPKILAQFSLSLNKMSFPVHLVIFFQSKWTDTCEENYFLWPIKANNNYYQIPFPPFFPARCILVQTSTEIKRNLHGVWKNVKGGTAIYLISLNMRIRYFQLLPTSLPRVLIDSSYITHSCIHFSINQSG